MVNSRVTGITISPHQVRVAKKLAERNGVNAEFLLMDAAEMNFNARFDAIWSIEAISHFHAEQKFFNACFKALKSDGMLVFVD